MASLSLNDPSAREGRPQVGPLPYVLGLVLLASACSEPGPSLLPWPTSLEQGGGELALTPAGRIVILQPDLQPLVPILAEEIRLATGLEFEGGQEAGPIGAGSETAGSVEADPQEAGPGDIVLQIVSSLAEEDYSLSIDSMIRVKGGSYGGVAMGTTTLLQAMRSTEDGAAVPRLVLSDGPQSAYRGLMVDLARQWHTVEGLKQIIVMCRLYKIRYLHLHLTDNQSFTFPSRAYPNLATPGRHYTWDELEELEAFAWDRGVTLVPEVDIPGHSYAMVTARPDLFGISQLGENPYVVNMGREEVYTALDEIFGEIATVFRSSPYIHIGGDETWLAFLEEDPDAKAFMERHQIPDTDELYRYFIARMNEIVKRHGKQTIVWEGFRKEGEIEIPRDILVMAWETAYQVPQDLLDAGYTIVNVSWKPLYVVRNRRWSPEYIYGWNMYRWENWYRPTPSFLPIQLEPNKKIMGAQMAAWEQAEIMEIPSLRRRLPALSERIWDPLLERGVEDFGRRLSAADSLLQLLIRPAAVELSGQKHPDYAESFFNRENVFHDTLTLEAHPLRDGYTIFFSTDTTAEPREWSGYTGPLQLTESTSLWLRLEDASGRSVGFPWRTDYEFRPLTLTTEGLAEVPLVDPAAEPSIFHDSLTLTLGSSRVGGRIHFTLDGDTPSTASPPYRDPVALMETSTLRARLFSSDGAPLGETLTRQFRKVGFTENITTHRPVTTSQGRDPNPSALLAVDGMVDRDSYWGTDARGSSPWLQIDLGGARKLTGVDLFTYWDGRRHYRYTIELSLNGQSWTEVVDARENTTPATEEGYHHAFEETEGRFVRITVRENSANSWVHIVEVRVY